MPDFHDGAVDGLFVSSKTARIFLRTYTGERFTLFLQEVERLHAENFRQGNIVFSVDFFRPEQLSREFIFEVYESSEPYKQNFVMENWVQEAKQKGLVALEISTSYGCSASALFKHYELLEGYVLSNSDHDDLG
jgi:hypothetical protein